ncbi:phenylalanine 4-monooxygenase [Flammeovirga yaeyamensis]|uniref:Phenylalanine-4-hydroxylase n=1 Tax=Flammeovirga yaeyamensis TaxID=367791 RepID=A0AAX1MXL0_9BACT|nr:MULTISPECIES: phenylalanine 4-monooxygenase [Flammeovirga]ANQ48547.1 phenylalanine 4-monooxygenase [Flammeovirga sp. MY04]MBB3696441.1 phenylalanine-4-hydroxylase [Flammeovirga yaeyamensis]NMF35120.1 phenylalanine 4-monooxygenase [Flammeovirga yaeyamensis]QWG00060.1 phenylalanine 4-monooxygenase [Flammeovirga yaeyamensis]
MYFVNSQEYDKYTQDDLSVWKTLFERQMKMLPNLAEDDFLHGVRTIQFTANKIPDFKELDQILGKETGWGITPVTGLIPNKEFFELLKAKRFPSSSWFRKLSELDYLEEPDMFHDIFGHVPLLTNADFCKYLEKMSVIALKYIENEHIIELISRLYWYTVEFGLIQTEHGLRIYGAGILSSKGESEYSLFSDVPERADFNVLEILKTPYIKDKFQTKYWVIKNYSDLTDSLDELDQLLSQINDGSLIVN